MPEAFRERLVEGPKRVWNAAAMTAMILTSASVANVLSPEEVVAEEINQKPGLEAFNASIELERVPGYFWRNDRAAIVTQSDNHHEKPSAYSRYYFDIMYAVYGQMPTDYDKVAAVLEESLKAHIDVTQRPEFTYQNGEKAVVIPMTPDIQAILKKLDFNDLPVALENAVIEKTRQPIQMSAADQVISTIFPEARNGWRAREGYFGIMVNPNDPIESFTDMLIRNFLPTHLKSSQSRDIAIKLGRKYKKLKNYLEPKIQLSIEEYNGRIGAAMRFTQQDWDFVYTLIEDAFDSAKAPLSKDFFPTQEELSNVNKPFTTADLPANLVKDGVKVYQEGDRYIFSMPYSVQINGKGKKYPFRYNSASKAHAGQPSWFKDISIIEQNNEAWISFENNFGEKGSLVIWMKPKSPHHYVTKEDGKKLQKPHVLGAPITQ